MAFQDRTHNNHISAASNEKRKEESLKNKTASDYEVPKEIKLLHMISDCGEFLRQLPGNSVQLICIDPPYNLKLAGWDRYDDYIEWASKWIDEAYRVLSINGSMVIFGGMQFRNAKSGDLLDIIQYIRKHTKFKLINTIIWHYKNGMSANRFFANRHEEAIWLVKSNNYYFDLDSVRVPYSKEEMRHALKDKRLNPETVRKGKNPTNVWEIGRLSANSKERVGHPAQKPVVLIERFVKALSYPGSTVLDFFAGSGTVGRVCIKEGRNCLMCDSDETSLGYFEKHLSLMEELGQNTHYIKVDKIDKFFEQ